MKKLILATIGFVFLSCSKEDIKKDRYSCDCDILQYDEFSSFSSKSSDCDTDTGGEIETDGRWFYIITCK